MGILVVDTAGFFAPTRRLRQLLGEGNELATVDFVVFEFVKVIESELNRARAAGDSRRETLLLNLRSRFPSLLRDLDVKVQSPDFTSSDVEETYSLVLNDIDAGDSMIWLKMRKLGRDTIITDDVADWRRLGAKVIPVR